MYQETTERFQLASKETTNEQTQFMGVKIQLWNCVIKYNLMDN